MFPPLLWLGCGLGDQDGVGVGGALEEPEVREETEWAQATDTDAPTKPDHTLSGALSLPLASAPRPPQAAQVSRPPETLPSPRSSSLGPRPRQGLGLECPSTSSFLI